MEKDGLYYDHIYKQGGFNQMYHKHYKQSIYYPIWTKTIDLLTKVNKPTILDIGCGVGQFANLLFDHGFQRYQGIDFSKEAIALAKNINPEQRDQFAVDNAYTTSFLQQDFDVVILFEVLEHMADDLEVLGKIKKGTTVLMSVPNFDDVSHVRYFQSEADVRTRYERVLDIKQLYTFNLHGHNKIFLCETTRKD